MRMKKYIVLLAGCLGLNAACRDFLELDESQYHTREYQFATFERTKQVATNVYGYVRDGLADVASTMRDAATDDAVYAWPTNGIKRYYDGSWSAMNRIDDQWEYYYAAVAAANYFLENCPSDFPDSRYQENYKEKIEQLRNYPLEVRALRAYFHFELLKRYNRIILADRSFSTAEVNGLEPAAYREAAAWIAGECDSVIPYLPVSYRNTTKGELARVTKGMALALKARVLLYAASPLNNPAGDKAEWLKAAAAAKDLIDSGIYQLTAEETTNNPEAAGLIFGKWNGANNDFERANFPIGYEGGNSGVCPSQNLAEAFDLRDGTPFDWNNEQHRALALLPAQRDPRFGKTLLVNGQLFKGLMLETFVNGRNGSPKEGATPTSYYLRKHLKEETSLVAGSETSYPHVFPLFRYAEVYLNYAEALLEAEKDPEYTGAESGTVYTLSPHEAVNRVRNRAGMPDLPALPYADFRRRLRNERRVELAFEGHRFWDIRRWKTGAATETVYGLSITSDAAGGWNCRRVVVQERPWNEKMNFYPIPDSEVFKNSRLVQNEGWE